LEEGLEEVGEALGEARMGRVGLLEVLGEGF
jgi:hypothetical protein